MKKNWASWPFAWPTASFFRWLWNRLWSLTSSKFWPEQATARSSLPPRSRLTFPPGTPMRRSCWTGFWGFSPATLFSSALCGPLTMVKWRDCTALDPFASSSPGIQTVGRLVLCFCCTTTRSSWRAGTIPLGRFLSIDKWVFLFFSFLFFFGNSSWIFKGKMGFWLSRETNTRGSKDSGLRRWIHCMAVFIHWSIGLFSGTTWMMLYWKEEFPSIGRTEWQRLNTQEQIKDSTGCSMRQCQIILRW